MTASWRPTADALDPAEDGTDGHEPDEDPGEDRADEPGEKRTGKRAERGGPHASRRAIPVQRSGSTRGSAATSSSSRRSSSARSARSRRRPGLLGGYGWWMYAFPVLIVVTVLVLVDTAREQSSSTGTQAAGQAKPVVTENTAPIGDSTSNTAALPMGPTFPESGAGTWRVLPGSGPVVGKGKVFHYQIAVEDGIDPSVYDGDDAFSSTVDAILDNPKSWIGSGTVALQRVDASYPNPDFVISLTTPNTDHRPDLCGYEIPYESSCWRRSAKRVVINVARWVRGAVAFDGDLGLYREYAINHEVGHVFGNQHVGCATNGGLAPVMMQQTFGVTDDYVWQVNQTDPTNKYAVPRDGKTCRVNAWPYPEGAGYSPDTPPNTPPNS